MTFVAEKTTRIDRVMMAKRSHRGVAPHRRYAVLARLRQRRSRARRAFGGSARPPGRILAACVEGVGATPPSWTGRAFGGSARPLGRVLAKRDEGTGATAAIMDRHARASQRSGTKPL